MRPSPILPLGAAEDLTDSEPAGSGVVAGFREAGPIAVAGLVANGANVVVTVVVARLLTSRGYGELAQLNGVFLFLSMPGSALLVGVVRRAASLRTAGRGADVRQFARRLHRLSLGGVALMTLVAFLIRDQVEHALSLDGSGAVVPIVAAGGFWLALSVDRGLLQARREYKALAGNLLVEGGVRMAFVLVLTSAGLGVTGACVGSDCSARPRPPPMLDSSRLGGGRRRPGIRTSRAAGSVTGSRRHLAADVADGFRLPGVSRLSCRTWM